MGLKVAGKIKYYLEALIVGGIALFIFGQPAYANESSTNLTGNSSLLSGQSNFPSWMNFSSGSLFSEQQPALTKLFNGGTELLNYGTTPILSTSALNTKPSPTSTSQAILAAIAKSRLRALMAKLLDTGKQTYKGIQMRYPRLPTYGTILTSIARVKGIALPPTPPPNDPSTPPPVLPSTPPPVLPPTPPPVEPPAPPVLPPPPPPVEPPPPPVLPPTPPPVEPPTPPPVLPPTPPPVEPPVEPPIVVDPGDPNNPPVDPPVVPPPVDPPTPPPVNPPSAEGAPVITSVTGGIAQGSIGLISGTNLVNQDSSHWLHFTELTGSFEEGSAGWEVWNDDGSDVSFDSSAAILGNMSFRNHIYCTDYEWNNPKEESGKGIFAHVSWWDAPDSGQYYYRYYVRYSGPVFKWTDNSFKQLYVHHLFNMCPCMWDNIPAGMGPSMYDLQGDNRIFVSLGKRMKLDTWYCIELFVGKLGNGVAVQFWLDGKQCPIYDEDKHTVLPEGVWNSCYSYKGNVFGPLELGTINCQNWSYGQLPVDENIWFDGFAMSPNGRIYPGCIVEIGNNEDYNAAVKVTQPINHMSDQEIEFTVDLNVPGTPGSTAEGAPLPPGVDSSGNPAYYLWVTNNRGLRSAPYQLQ